MQSYRKYLMVNTKSNRREDKLLFFIIYCYDSGTGTIMTWLASFHNHFMKTINNST